MDYSKRLAISYYKTIATLHEAHKVYLVQHQETGKIYVKKVLDIYNYDIYAYLYHNHISGTPRMIELYEDEQQLIVIEDYVSGCTLQEKIDTNDITIDSVYRYTMEICSILEDLHSLNPPIIHRDIKPSNIIITEHEHVILLDFNAAKYFTKENANDTVLLGTKGYAAPEQYGFGSSSPRTDIYAIGILLKELSAVLPSGSELLDTIIDKCVQMNPDDRFPSVTELKHALEQVMHPSAPEEPVAESFTLRSLLPPGYRTLTPWKMILASVSYFVLFWLVLNIQVENTFGAKLWLERIIFLSILLFIIFGSFNYLNVQRFFPLCKHKFRIVHYIGVVLMNITVAAMLLIIMSVAESVFF